MGIRKKSIVKGWDETIMEDFQVLVGILATSGIAINIYLIKSIANLCERLAVLETKLHTA